MMTTIEMIKLLPADLKFSIAGKALLSTKQGINYILKNWNTMGDIIINDPLLKLDEILGENNEYFCESCRYSFLISFQTRKMLLVMAGSELDPVRYFDDEEWARLVLVKTIKNSTLETIYNNLGYDINLKKDVITCTYKILKNVHLFLRPIDPLLYVKINKYKFLATLVGYSVNKNKKLLSEFNKKINKVLDGYDIFTKVTYPMPYLVYHSPLE